MSDPDSAWFGPWPYTDPDREPDPAPDPWRNTDAGLTDQLLRPLDELADTVTDHTRNTISPTTASRLTDPVELDVDPTVRLLVLHVTDGKLDENVREFAGELAARTGRTVVVLDPGQSLETVSEARMRGLGWQPLAPWDDPDADPLGDVQAEIEAHPERYPASVPRFWGSRSSDDAGADSTP